MTREEKIAAIYEAMANKKRTFGCRCKRNDGEDVIFIRQNKTGSYLSIRENEEFTVSLGYTPKVIGHPVMIGDVIDWIEKKDFDVNAKILGFGFEDEERLDDEGKLFLIQDYYTNKIIAFWDKKRESIDAQSDECIDLVYSLIPSKSME